MFFLVEHVACAAAALDQFVLRRNKCNHSNYQNVYTIVTKTNQAEYTYNISTLSVRVMLGRTWEVYVNVRIDTYEALPRAYSVGFMEKPYFQSNNIPNLVKR